MRLAKFGQSGAELTRFDRFVVLRFRTPPESVDTGLCQHLSEQLCGVLSPEQTDVINHAARIKMPPATEATAGAASTLTTAKQSTQLLKLLQSVLQGSVRDLRRYLATGGTPNARIFQAQHDKSCYVNSEDYTGPGAVEELSLLEDCCFRQRTHQIELLLDGDVILAE